MPKLVSESMLNKLVAFIGKSSNGMSAEEILNRSKLTLPKRTLQRRINRLVGLGLLKKEGAGRNSRYYTIDSEKPLGKSKDKVKKETKPIYQISELGKKIKKYIEQPIQKRKIVGYDRRFFERYHPNRTFYLSSAVRRHLQTRGRIIKTDQPAGTYAKEISERLLVDLSWNSSRLEGNTYSLLDTENLIIHNQNAIGKSAFETQMILNHKAAIKFIIDNVNLINFNRYTILNLHALLSDNLLGNSLACGRLRLIPVQIGKTVYHPLEVPQLIEECFDQLLASASAIRDPFEQAFFIMVQLPYLQPFEDVNKRVSRLAANIPLIKMNLCPLSFIDIPLRDYIDGILGVYECNQVELLSDLFVWAYERSVERYSVVRGMLGEPDTFRLKYYQEVKSVVAKIVKESMNKKAAMVYLKKYIKESIQESDRLQFISTIETELSALNEGNIARFEISLDAFNRWQKVTF